MTSQAETSEVVPQKEAHKLSEGAAMGTGAHPGLESRGRILVKAISWRVTAWIITVGIVWAATGEVRFAAAVGLADFLLKIGTYYLHERAWNRISVGHIAR